MSITAFDLDRFLDAQDDLYGTALAELRVGRKQSHWIWFVFPQVRGLGSSPASVKYGLAGLPEARAYAAHPVLGARLREATVAMLSHRHADAESILGELDAMKFKSSMTLFSLAEPEDELFTATLQRFFASERDSRTIALLGL